LKVLLEGLHLRGSTTREGKNIKRHYHVLLATEIAELDFLALCGLQFEIRQYKTDPVQKIQAISS